MKNIKRIKQSKKKTQLTDRDRWRTPPYLLNDAKKLLGITEFSLDACAMNSEVAVCKNFISEKKNALTVHWQSAGMILCNPPFSRKWAFFNHAAKCVRLFKSYVLMVLPYDPVTDNWRHYVDKTSCLVFVPSGRYQFLLPDGRESRDKTGKLVGPEFPVALVLIHPHICGGAKYINYQRGNKT